MNLSEKIVANRQKRNLWQIYEKQEATNLEGSVVREIYYPASSELLHTVVRNIADGVLQKKFYIFDSQDWESELITRMESLCSRANTALCFFPNYSPRVDGVVSDLPVLEVSGNSIKNWYDIAKSQDLHFFLCMSPDLKQGVALDVYEADPLMHQTAGAVCDLYFWGV